MRTLLRSTVLCLLMVSAILAGERSANWSASYSECDRHSELLKKTHLNLGIRFLTSNPELVRECARALDFWATVLDLEWHEDDSRGCAIQIVVGRPDLFIRTQVARGRFPNRSGFQGFDRIQPKD